MSTKTKTKVSPMRLEITRTVWDSLPKQHKRQHKNGEYYALFAAKGWVNVFWRR